MGTFHLAIDIDQPVPDVFAFIAEPQNLPRWYEAVDQVTKTTPGPTEAQSMFRITRSLPGGTADNDVEITEYTPNHRIVIESRNGPTPFRYRYDIEPNGSGTTLTLDGRISSEGLAGPAAHLDRLATQLFKHGMNQNLHQLKRIVETSHIDDA